MPYPARYPTGKPEPFSYTNSSYKANRSPQPTTSASPTLSSNIASQKPISQSGLSFAASEVVKHIKALLSKVWNFFSRVFCLYNPLRSYENILRMKPEKTAQVLADDPISFLKILVEAHHQDPARAHSITKKYRNNFERILIEWRILNQQAGLQSFALSNQVSSETLKRAKENLSDEISETYLNTEENKQTAPLIFINYLTRCLERYGRQASDLLKKVVDRSDIYITYSDQGEVDGERVIYANKLLTANFAAFVFGDFANTSDDKQFKHVIQRAEKSLEER